MRIRQKLVWAMAAASAVGLMSVPGAIAAFEPLSASEVEAALTGLPGWQSDGMSLTCTYRFGNFVEAIAFVNQLVEPAERIGHHPDLSISYNVVGLSLTTHDAGGLTTLDTQMATEIVQLSSAQGLPGCVSPAE